MAYPRCGTHCITQTIQLILNKGESAQTYAEYTSKAPILQLYGMKHSHAPRVIRTHLLFEMLEFSRRGKYVYVTWSPLDCCMSCFHVMKELHDLQFDDGQFEDFFDAFLGGKVRFWSYFKHIDTGHSRRDESNFFVTYEEIKHTTHEVISRLACFLGEDYRKKTVT